MSGVNLSVGQWNTIVGALDEAKTAYHTEIVAMSGDEMKGQRHAWLHEEIERCDEVLTAIGDAGNEH